MNKDLHAVLTVRLFGQGKCFGPGIAELLQKVEELHSLRAAATAMGMAYSKAWTTVKTCEERLQVKLIDYKTGGKNGGGSAVTAEGKAILAAYLAVCVELENVQKEVFSKHFGHILDIKE